MAWFEIRVPVHGYAYRTVEGVDEDEALEAYRSDPGNWDGIEEYYLEHRDAKVIGRAT